MKVIAIDVGTKKKTKFYERYFSELLFSEPINLSALIGYPATSFW